MDFLKVAELGIIFALLMVHNAIAAPESDLIEKLPGQTEIVPFKQYGGYITTDEEHGRALYYYFVEAQTNATSRPLVLWLNGGPGCSSLGLGAFEENGPFKLNGEVLEQNKFSWNTGTDSNMLYVESPIGVGFSYSNTSSDYDLLNDTLTAQDNLAFLLNWFQKFPEFLDTFFYIIGESYAGHYIPQLATLVIDHNKNSNVTPINLKGIAIGNPFFDIDISINNGEFMWSHGLISDETYQLTQTICNNSRLWTEKYLDQNTSEACNNTFKKVYAESGDINDYDVTLGICLDEKKISKLQGGILSNFEKNGVNLCADDDTFTYLNTNEVQVVLHASRSNDTIMWKICNRSLHYDQRNRGINIIPIVIELLNSNLPIMLFSGDQDSVIPFTATRTIVNIIAKQSKLFTIGTYGTWYNNQQVAGWTQSYGHIIDGKNQTMLKFASVRGAAHQVPYTSPSEALTLFKAFIGGLPLPTS
ncbi:serine carboxypeptidase-like 45 [Cryptomeria japonica]|uniref:serine carboxypeptidase-like 45 n=1 Tax=Cryptomeria japonica TaxID=3369 RepID=UPI0025ABBD87|nr:serine carboxypeptidase-like 45 [Cryptomeria japonica]